MKIELFFRPHLYPGGDVKGIIEVGRLADQAGLRTILFGEHMLMVPGTERAPHKTWPHGLQTPWLEPLTTMAAIASVTENVRFSMGILLGALRPAVLLAKTVATLDVLSDGRVDLAIGPGWQPEEYEASGLKWADRYHLMDESIRLCRELWGTQPAAIHGRDFSLEEVHQYPRPVQDRIPVLYGVKASPANIKRIAALGDGWYPVQVNPDDVKEGVIALREAYRQEGRDPATLQVRALSLVFQDDGRLDVPRCVDLGQEFMEAGATTVCIGPDRQLDSIEELHDLIGQLAEVGAKLG